MKRIIMGGIAIILIAIGGVMLWQREPGETETSVADSGAKSDGEAAAQSGPLAVGVIAPDFTTQGALAGKEFTLKLSDALAKGPLILYFFPKVFTEGCTLEAREFSEAAPEIEKLGGQVIGMSADAVPELAKFSTQECRDKFAVAHADPSVIAKYGVALPGKSMTNRTSYVIAKDGRVAFVHSDLSYKEHVKLTVAELKKLAAPAN